MEVWSSYKTELPKRKQSYAKENCQTSNCWEPPAYPQCTLHCHIHSGQARSANQRKYNLNTGVQTWKDDVWAGLMWLQYMKMSSILFHTLSWSDTCLISCISFCLCNSLQINWPNVCFVILKSAIIFLESVFIFVYILSLDFKFSSSYFNSIFYFSFCWKAFYTSSSLTVPTIVLQSFNHIIFTQMFTNYFMATSYFLP